MQEERVTGKELWSGKNNKVCQGNKTVWESTAVPIRRWDWRRVADNVNKNKAVSNSLKWLWYWVNSPIN